MRQTVQELITALEQQPRDRYVEFQTSIRDDANYGTHFLTYNGVGRVETDGSRAVIVVHKDA